MPPHAWGSIFLFAAPKNGRERAMRVEAKLEELGLALPGPTKTPQGLVLPFSWVRVRGDRAYVSGHVPLNPDGSVAEPLGKVGAGVSEEQGYEAARLTALAMLATIKAAVGDLGRVRRVVKLLGMVNCTEDFTNPPQVINGASELFIELWGDLGQHARSAVGLQQLPNGMAVEIEGIFEVEE